jgi:Flavodoxin
MHALVVFESMYGNTRQIAEAVAAGLATVARTDLAEVSDAPMEIPGDVDLLVVGGPTHAFGMTRPGTRRDAAKYAAGPLVPGGTGIREWLEQLTAGSRRIDAAAFDTKIRRPPLPGSAAKGAQRRLSRRGFAVLEPARTFWVRGTQGPLCEGEEERARQWGAGLASKLAARQPAG